MKKIKLLSILTILLFSVIFSFSCASNSSSNSSAVPDDFVFVKGNGAIKDFYICKHEVTQGEYEKIMGYNPSYTKGANNPVEFLSVFDAVAYCNERSKKEGKEPYYILQGLHVSENPNGNGYRLPTYQEWYYAAMGGTTEQKTKYAGSDNISEVAWYKNNSLKMTQAVMQKKPNELGLYDMTGNVSEYCYNTSQGAYYYAPDTGTLEFEERRTGQLTMGGNIILDEEQCSLPAAMSCDPSSVFNFVGFRVVL